MSSNISDVAKAYIYSDESALNIEKCVCLLTMYEGGEAGYKHVV